MKITKQELQEIIKEEAVKFKRALELKKELAVIEEQLDEVEAGDLYTPSKTAGPKFSTKFDKENAGTPNQPKAGDDQATFMREEEDDEEECGISDEEYSEEGGISDDEAYVKDDALEENLEEPMEGTSVAQHADESDVEDGYTKTDKLKESKEEKGNILSEEQARMKELAGLLK